MPNQNEQSSAEAPRNQAGQGQNDDPRVAPESGEPQDARRSRGRAVDEKTHEMEGTTPPGKEGDSKDWESGRHQSM